MSRRQLLTGYSGRKTGRVYRTPLRIRFGTPSALHGIVLSELTPDVTVNLRHRPPLQVVQTQIMPVTNLAASFSRQKSVRQIWRTIFFACFEITSQIVRWPSKAASRNSASLSDGLGRPSYGSKFGTVAQAAREVSVTRRLPCEAASAARGTTLSFGSGGIRA